MNELDRYTLDQKSWAFLNLIGQTPNTFPVVGNITVSGNGAISGNLSILGAINGPSLTLATPLYPATPATSVQSATALYAGTGAPNNANGNNGDIYFRSDGGALTTIYQRRAGAWVGII